MKKTVLYIVEDEKSAQFRYRVKNTVEATSKSDRWGVKWVLRSELKKAEAMLEKVDLVVILRQTAKDSTVLDFVRKVKAMRIKVLFDLDDLIFDYRDLPLLMKTTNSKNVFYWMGYFWGIRRIAKRVDGFICTNDYLAKKLERSFNKPVQVIRNSLNQEQVEISEKLVKKKNTKRDSFEIGYFSGSPTHVKDFRLVEPELMKFLTKYDDVIIKVVGEMEFSREMEAWIKKGRVEVSNKVDYLRLQELVCEVDINIAPLIVNDFTNCKSELKFFEAAVVETTTIASPAYAFKKTIIDGKNGFLAKQGKWYDKLEYIYEHREDNQKIALEAKKYAMKHYYGREFLKEVEVTYDYFAN